MLSQLYSDFARTFDASFGTGLQTIINSGLAATTGPLTALLVIYVVITGWLIMRGELAPRPGIFRVVRAGVVVMALSAAYYNTYVRDLFLTALPDWFASSLGAGPGASPLGIPQQLDLVRSATMHQTAVIYAHTGIENIDSRMSARIIDGCVTVALGFACFIYVIAKAFTGLVVCIGPFILAGYLFDATKPIVEGWISKLVSLSVLSLLVSITAVIIVQADSQFVRNVATTMGDSIDIQVENLWAIAAFFVLMSCVLAGLPGLAYSIGRGIAINTSAGQLWAAPARALDRIRTPAFSRAGQ